MTRTQETALPRHHAWNAVQNLPDGPLDLVGDIHGELPTLDTLLGHLGYTPSGTHPQGRRLVFLGDLIDRGPDSPGVVRRVADMVERGRAFALMGNHDLNAILRLPKKENTWLFDHGPVSETETKVANDRDREEILGFLARLPVALRRDDLRLVHACWDDAALKLLEGETGATQAFSRHKERIKATLGANADPIARNLALQNGNPMKLVTSGPEVRAPQPFFAGGKERHEARHPWWNDCAAGPMVVFGHYWRIPVTGIQKDDGLFRGVPLNRTLGHGHAMCIDYSVGGRWHDRKEGRLHGPFTGRLAALRWPERTLVFDNGEQATLDQPGRDA
ncbi:MAG: metallophosphoesterase [Phycisphaerales bacterium]|nr:metallophosphoesterase [Phycisphaerales bacterium]